MNDQRLYLDHASAWPLRPEAAQAVADAGPMSWADPARPHLEGRAAADLLDRASATVTETLGLPDRGLVWTSSGTEAIHLAVLGSARAAERRGDLRRHIVTSAVEHSAVLRACERLRDDNGYALTVVGVDRSGLVDVDEILAALRPDTLAVHLQYANHEVGALQPTHEVSNACREVGALLHVDACQAIGQLGLTASQLGADLVSASAAKFGGPGGVGFLGIAPRGRIDAVLEGDDRQRRRRAGSVSVPAIAGAAVALKVATVNLDAERSTREIARRHVRAGLAAMEDIEVHGPLADAHPGIVAASALYVEGETLLRELDLAGFAVHSGSSCASTTGEPSHVLVAMQALTHGHVRVSVGPDTTVADADRFLAAYADIVARLRATAGMAR